MATCYLVNCHSDLHAAEGGVPFQSKLKIYMGRHFRQSEAGSYKTEEKGTVCVMRRSGKCIAFTLPAEASVQLCG